LEYERDDGSFESFGHIMGMFLGITFGLLLGAQFNLGGRRSCIGLVDMGGELVHIAEEVHLVGD